MKFERVKTNCMEYGRFSIGNKVHGIYYVPNTQYKEENLCICIEYKYKLIEVKLSCDHDGPKTVTGNIKELDIRKHTVFAYILSKVLDELNWCWPTEVIKQKQPNPYFFQKIFDIQRVQSTLYFLQKVLDIVLIL